MHICIHKYMHIQKMSQIKQIFQPKQAIITRQAPAHIKFNYIITNLLKTQICRRSTDQFSPIYDAQNLATQTHYKQSRNNINKSDSSRKHRRYVSQADFDGNLENYRKLDLISRRQTFMEAKKIMGIEDQIKEKANYLLRPYLHPQDYQHLKLISFQNLKDLPQNNPKNCLKKVNATKSKMCTAMKKHKKEKSCQNMISVSYLEKTNSLSIGSVSRVPEAQNIQDADVNSIINELKLIGYEQLYNRVRRKVTHKVFSDIERQKVIEGYTSTGRLKNKRPAKETIKSTNIIHNIRD